MKERQHKTGNPDDLLDNTAFLVLDTGRLMRKRFDEKMRSFGLTRPEWYLIAHMYFFDGLSQQELADAMDVTKGGMAKLVARMEEKGLVSRESEARDGRATKRVCLTERGWSLARKVDAESVRTVSASVSPLTAQEAQQLHEMLRRVRSGLLEKAPRQKSKKAA